MEATLCEPWALPLHWLPKAQVKCVDELLEHRQGGVAVLWGVGDVGLLRDHLTYLVEETVDPRFDALPILQG